MLPQKRELREESGYEYDTFRIVHVHQPESKIEWIVYAVIAYGNYSQYDPLPDAGEKIVVQTAPLEDVMRTNHRLFTQMSDNEIRIIKRYL